MTYKPKFHALVAILLLLAAAPAASIAQTSGAKAIVDSAKVQGQVGEQADGFLGVVSDGGPALRAAVSEINAGRAQAYREAAAKTGVSAAAAGQATAQQLFTRLAPGQFYKPAGGNWTKK